MIDNIETIHETSKHLPLWMRFFLWSSCTVAGIIIKFNAVLITIVFSQWVSYGLQWLCWGGGILTAAAGFYDFLVKHEVIEKDALKNKFRKKK